jgi:hypothetical protein
MASPRAVPTSRPDRRQYRESPGRTSRRLQADAAPSVGIFQEKGTEKGTDLFLPRVSESAHQWIRLGQLAAG